VPAAAGLACTSRYAGTAANWQGSSANL
jgi:hypothetical protein